MSLLPESMLAATFAWTTESGATPDAVLTVSGTPYDINVATGNYRICLAPTTGSVTDFLRVLQTALNAAGSGLTYGVTLADDGKCSIAATGTFTFAPSSTLNQTLGAGLSGTGAELLSTYPPKHCAFFAARLGSDWSPRESLVGRETVGGTQYGVLSGARYEECEHTFRWIPRDQAYAVTSAEDALTPWNPTVTDIDAINSHDVPWSVRDFCVESLGKVVAYAQGDYQTMRASTSLYYDRVSLAAADLASPRVRLHVEGWRTYLDWTVRLLRIGVLPVETRA